MVFTASGQPLYLPLNARKYRQTTSGHINASDVRDNGMQSLLSAIELDMSNRSMTEHVSEASMHSSFVDSPDHQELMADLLRTSFTNEDGEPQDLGHDPMSHTDPENSFVPALIPADTSASQIPLSDSQEVQSDHFAYQLQEPVKRFWSGPDARCADKSARIERIRTVVAQHLTVLTNSAPVPVLGRVIRFRFSWPAVAQKSYGTEKRLLTPAPICKILGSYKELCGTSPKAHLTIVPDEASHQSIPQTLNFDHQVRASYKNLHINNDNIGKSKSVRLKLQVAQKDFGDPLDIPLAEFVSSDVVLLSKPSKRTSRLKLQSSFVYSGDSISLYNRINSQTVRTKYLTCEQGQMTVQADTWTPFRIYTYTDSQMDQTSRPLLYGMPVVLSDTSTGFVSCPMVVRRLDGKTVDDGGPDSISQMQKIIFEKVMEPGPAFETTPEGFTLPATRHRMFLSARQAQFQKDLSANCSEAVFETYHPRSDGSGVIEMDDCGQWTIVGVGSTEFTFLDTLSDPYHDSPLPPSPTGRTSQSAPNVTPTKSAHGNTKKRKLDENDDPALAADQNLVLSKERSTVSTTSRFDDQNSPLSSLRIQIPLTPFPTLLSPPVFLPESNRLHIQIRDFWQPSSALSAPEIWLGSHGPLQITALQQSVVYQTDAALEVELPTREEVGGVSEAPLLFVREDGVVSVAGCQVLIRD